MKVRKKPVEVEAMKFDGSVASALGIREWAGPSVTGNPDGTLTIHTLEGDMKAQPGDWIVRGVRGEYHPVRGDIFEETYEVLEP